MRLHLLLFLSPLALEKSHRRCLVAVLVRRNLVQYSRLVCLHFRGGASSFAGDVGIYLHLLQAIADLLYF